MTTAADAIRLLNEALAMDRKAIESLVLYRVPLNGHALADHPTIRVGIPSSVHVDPPGLHVGVLGIINGIFGSEIGSAWDQHGHIIAFVEHSELN